MYYVYLLRSVDSFDQTYIGYTTNLEKRLEAHNAGWSLYTARLGKWELVSFIGFMDKAKALKFERYLKVGSGHAFAKKHLW